jgi:hypothetical protein
MQQSPLGFSVRAISQKNSVCSKGLPGHNDVGAFGRNFPPVVGVAQDDIDVVARREIDSDIFPGAEARRAAGTIR